jgi:hypothetical protein
MSRHTVMALALMMLVGGTAMNAEANTGYRYRAPTIYVKNAPNMRRAEDRGIVNKAVGFVTAADHGMRQSLAKQAFGLRSSEALSYLGKATIEVTAVKLTLGKRTQKGRALKKAEVTATVRSPAGGRTKTATVKLDRAVLKAVGAALDVEFN